jgi:DNA-binding LacI/PurR family transcriptional regulator
MLTAPSDIPSLEDRRAGFVQELKSRGLKAPIKDVIVKAERFDFSSGYVRAKELLTERPSVTGIFCANDEMAAGVLRAAREIGRSVPGDLSVIGFDDIIMSRYVDPPLSTISFDKEALGRRAMARLLEQVTTGADGVLHQIVPVELVVRGSAGQLKKRRGA